MNTPVGSIYVTALSSTLRSFLEPDAVRVLGSSMMTLTFSGRAIRSDLSRDLSQSALRSISLVTIVIELGRTCCTGCCSDASSEIRMMCWLMAACGSSEASALGLPLSRTATPTCVGPVVVAGAAPVPGRPGASRHCQDEDDEDPPCAGGLVSVVVIVVSVVRWSFGSRLKRQMGIIQWPDLDSFIWKCREPGLGSILTPPLPRNQISPVLHRYRTSFCLMESMPMSPGTP